MNEIKNKDVILVSYLRKNARESLTTISRKTKIPVSTVFDKLKDFERQYISKHTSILNFKQLGFDIKINLLFKLPKESREEFKNFLLTNENVNSVYKINNGFDYLVEAIFRDIRSMQNFIDSLDRFKIEAKQELFVLEDLKREGFLEDELHVKLLMNPMSH